MRNMSVTNHCHLCTNEKCPEDQWDNRLWQWDNRLWQWLQEVYYKPMLGVWIILIVHIISNYVEIITVMHF